MGIDTLYIADVFSAVQTLVALVQVLPWPVQLAIPFVFGLLIVYGLNVAMAALQATTGIDAVPMLTLRFGAAPAACAPLDGTPCFNTDYARASLAFVSTCVSLRGQALEAVQGVVLGAPAFIASQCVVTAGYSRPLGNSTDYLAAYRLDNRENFSSGVAGGPGYACADMFASCAAAQGSPLASCPSSFNTTILQHDAACKGNGLYLLDPLPLTFISLMFYLGAFAITYYGSMIH